MIPRASDNGKARATLQKWLGFDPQPNGRFLHFTKFLAHETHSEPAVFQVFQLS